MQTLSAEQLKTHDHRQPANFMCSDCRKFCPVQTGSTTGYATTAQGKLLCYPCCGKRDAVDMEKRGKAMLYLTCEPAWYERKPHTNAEGVVIYSRDRRGTVGNWCGTLMIDCTTTTGRHNIAETRYDCRFVFGEYWWHGVTYGENTQICHCRRTKRVVTTEK